MTTISAPPTTRESIESVLRAHVPRLFEALLDLIRIHDLPRRGWARVPALDQTFTTAAVRALAMHLIETEGMGKIEAEDTACIRLGLNEKTFRGRERKWRLDSSESE